MIFPVFEMGDEARAENWTTSGCWMTTHDSQVFPATDDRGATADVFAMDKAGGGARNRCAGAMRNEENWAQPVALCGAVEVAHQAGNLYAQGNDHDNGGNWSASSPYPSRVRLGCYRAVGMSLRGCLPG